MHLNTNRSGIIKNLKNKTPLLAFRFHVVVVLSTLIVVSLIAGCGKKPVVPLNKRTQSVVLLHGLFRSANSMDAMEHALIEAGYETCNVNYPSTDFDIATLAKEYVLPEIQQCAIASDSVHVVTHSMGGIILRYLHSKGDLDNVGRVVMLGPPNQGSELVDELGGLDLFTWLNGPAGNELATSDTSLVQQLPDVSFGLGIIAGDYSFNPFYSSLIPGDDDGKVSVDRAKIAGMNDFIVMPVSHSFMMKDEDVIRQTLYFLAKGQFDVN
ncbi:MAG: esterase/lipase family protein [Rhodothermales bacterium]